MSSMPPPPRPRKKRPASSTASTAPSTAVSQPSTSVSNTSSKRSALNKPVGGRQKRLRRLEAVSTASSSRLNTSESSSTTSTLEQPLRRGVLKQQSRLNTATSVASIDPHSSANYDSRSASTRTLTETITAQTQAYDCPKTSTTYLDTGLSLDSYIVCAVTESRGVLPTVGLTCINLSTCQATLCQIVDGQMYVRTLQKLYSWSPSVVLYPSTIRGSRMMMFIAAEMENRTELREIDKKFFTEDNSLDHLQQLAPAEELEVLKVALEGNYYALAAFAGVLECLKQDGNYNFAPNSLRISLEPSDGSMMIDLATIHSLELIQNLHNAKSKDSLFGLLNSTQTPMGARLLRSWVLQPSTQPDVLTKRYEAVEELTSCQGLFIAARTAMKQFQDVDRVLTNIVILPSPKTLTQWQEQCINYVLVLKDFVSKIGPVFEALSQASSDLLSQIAEACAPETYVRVVEMIAETLNADTSYSKKPAELRNQKLYAVKSGSCDLLDVARTAHKETVDDALSHVEEQAHLIELSLEMSYDSKRSYFIRFPASELEGRTLDTSTFINVCKNKKMIECQTMTLLKMNDKMASSLGEVLLMSMGVVTELVQKIRAEIGPLFKISSSIALADVLTALADVATKNDYIRPQLASTTAIKAARHPLKSKISRNKFIPNDIYAPSHARLQILTGCNMSGKSTYIRTVALLQVMSQIGSFVPAEHAEICVRNQLFARISTDDNISNNASTFTAEMRETAYILDNVDSDAMVIVDELGRGTSTTDGLAIAIAVAEELLRSGALVWFVTHFHELAKYLDKQTGVSNLHLAVDLSRQNQMLMLYTIASGSVQEDTYGISLARVACLPAGLIQRARQVAQIIRERRRRPSEFSYTAIQARKGKVLLALRDQMIWAKASTMGGMELVRWMKALQDEFVIQMDELNQAEERLDRQLAASEESRELVTILTGQESSLSYATTAAEFTELGQTNAQGDHCISSTRRDYKEDSCSSASRETSIKSSAALGLSSPGTHDYKQPNTSPTMGLVSDQILSTTSSEEGDMANHSLSMPRILRQSSRSHHTFVPGTLTVSRSSDLESTKPSFLVARDIQEAKPPEAYGGPVKVLPPVPLFHSADTSSNFRIDNDRFPSHTENLATHYADDEAAMHEDMIDSEMHEGVLQEGDEVSEKCFPRSQLGSEGTTTSAVRYMGEARLMSGALPAKLSSMAGVPTHGARDQNAKEHDELSGALDGNIDPEQARNARSSAGLFVGHGQNKTLRSRGSRDAHNNMNDRQQFGEEEEDEDNGSLEHEAWSAYSKEGEDEQAKCEGETSNESADSQHNASDRDWEMDSDPFS